MWAKKKKRERTENSRNGMGIAGAKEANARFITQQEKGTRHWSTRDRRKNTESASKEVRDSQQSVLSRSPLRGTSMQDETRMHVSVRRSTSSKEENEA